MILRPASPARQGAQEIPRGSVEARSGLRMTDMRHDLSLVQRAALDSRPSSLSRRVRGLSDRAIAWLFIAPDDRAAARDQHLSADLDDLAFLHQLPRQPAERAGPRHRHRQLHSHPDRPRHLGGDAGDGAFRVLDDRAADADRLRARLSDRPQVPRSRLLDHGHPDPDDAVAGGGRQLLDVPLPAADRAVQLRRSPSSPASDRRRSRCSATSGWRRGRSSSSIPGCGRLT